MHVVALALEEGMHLDLHLDQRVAGRPAADSWHALPLEAQRLAVLRARRHAHVERLAVGQLDALLGALGGFQTVDRPGVGPVAEFGSGSGGDRRVRQWWM